MLAQQIVAVVAEDPVSIEDLADLLARTESYARLPRSSLVAVLDMLAGRFPSTDFAELRPRLHWDRETDLLSIREGAARIALLSGGTIPDRGQYAVHLGEDGPRIGELDEEMVHETKPGDVVHPRRLELAHSPRDHPRPRDRRAGAGRGGAAALLAR